MHFRRRHTTRHTRCGADTAVCARASHAQVRTYLTEQRGARILGVEIAPSAVSVATLPFSGPTAFILGNEGSGMSAAQCAVCDGFVYIPQHGPGTASLNVAVAAGIVLHRFAEWACYAEAGRDAEHPGKFEHGWEGGYRTNSEAAVFRNFREGAHEEFKEKPERPFYGELVSFMTSAALFMGT